ncbi:MAG TPA: hypothetical protein VM452_12770 [Caulifigura sp.]|nr:hypothetical protein [Caulifigura sp.]
MATAEQVTESSVDEAPSPPRRRRRRWPIVLLLLAAAVYAAPWFLSINGVAEQVTATALPWLPPGSNIGKPSLGWMSPVHLAGLKILDDDGRVLLECDHVTSQKSLWEMAASPNSPGGWVLEKPKAYLHVDPKGLNLNPVIRKFLARKRRAAPLNFDLTIEKGTIEFVDPDDRRLSTITDVSARYANSAKSRTFEATGDLNDGQTKGAIDLRGQWDDSQNEAPLPTATVTGNVSYVPLTLFRPWLAENSTVEEISGGGELTLSASSEPAAVLGKVAFKPRDALYRRHGEARAQPVPTSGLELNAQWDGANDRLTFHSFHATTGLVNLKGVGHIEQPRGAGIVELRTTADQDVTGMLDLLNPQIREHIVVKGLRVRNVAVTGALWPDDFVAKSPGEQPPPPATFAGDITWTDAVLYGVRATPGAVTAAFQPHGVALWPREVRVGDGQLVTLPEIQLVDHRQLVAPKGPMLVDVNITPEICREWLKFISPVVADATAVEGKMTLILESGQLPLSNPQAGEISGIVRLHSANVTPGPLAQQAIDSAAALARLITQKQPAGAEQGLQIELPPQDIAFRMQDGRVHHKGLRFHAGDLVVMTRGSVGLDHSLDMLVEIPMPEAWLDRGPVLRSLQGEVFTIALQGTLDRPQVDGRAIAEWGKRLGANAAGGLLQNLLEKGIDRAAEKAQRRRERRDAP